MTSVLNGSSQQGSILSLLKSAAGARTSGSAGQKAHNAIIDMIAKTDPEKAKQAKEQQDKGNTILQQLQSMKTDQNAERKEAARQKVEQLKKQIQALRMMAGGDPKAAARRAAQLARELSAATKEYASAGGKASELGDVSTPATQSAQSTPATDAQGTAPAQTTKGALSPPPTPDVAAASATDSIDMPQGSEPATKAPASDIVNQKIAEANKSQAEREADTLFSNDVRKLLNDLKQIVKSAQQKLRDGGESGETQDTRDAQKALREVEQSLGDIAGNGQANVFSAINIIV